MYKNRPKREPKFNPAHPFDELDKEATDADRRRYKAGLGASKGSYKNIHGLTDPQIVFINEYVVDQNMVRAAAMTNNHITTCARWLKQPNVQAAISSHFAVRRKANEALVKETLSQLLSVMKSDIRNVCDWENVETCDPESGEIYPQFKLKIKDLKDITDTRMIKSIEMTKNGPKIVMHDKTKAIELMMSGLGMLKKPEEAKETEIKLPSEGETSKVSLLEALQKAHEERKRLPSVTNGQFEIVDSSASNDVVNPGEKPEIEENGSSE